MNLLNEVGHQSILVFRGKHIHERAGLTEATEKHLLKSELVEDVEEVLDKPINLMGLWHLQSKPTHRCNVSPFTC